MLKDVATDSGEVPLEVWRHQVALGEAAPDAVLEQVRSGELLEPGASAVRVSVTGGERVSTHAEPVGLVVHGIDADSAAPAAA